MGDAFVAPHSITSSAQAAAVAPRRIAGIYDAEEREARRPRGPQNYLSNAETLKAAMGLRNPLSESWPAGSVAAKLSMIACTLESIKI